MNPTSIRLFLTLLFTTLSLAANTTTSASDLTLAGTIMPTAATSLETGLAIESKLQTLISSASAGTPTIDANAAKFENSAFAALSTLSSQASSAAQMQNGGSSSSKSSSGSSSESSSGAEEEGAAGERQLPGSWFAAVVGLVVVCVYW